VFAFSKGASRIWIVGTGPSLNQTPLDRIKEESVGLNRIHLIFGRTTWRPSYYFCTDLSRTGGLKPEDLRRWNDDFRIHLGIPMFTRDDLWEKRLDKDLRRVVAFLPFCQHFSPMDGKDPAPDEWHMPVYCRYGGSMLAAIQWASERYDEIVLVGADLGYGGNDAVNHFDPRYAPVDSYTPQQARWFNNILADAHAIAQRECARRGVKVYNATVGGDLESYPRVDIKTLLA